MSPKCTIKTAKNRFLDIDIVRNETRKYHMIYQVGIQAKRNYEMENKVIITL